MRSFLCVTELRLHCLFGALRPHVIYVPYVKYEKDQYINHRITILIIMVSMRAFICPLNCYIALTIWNYT